MAGNIPGDLALHVGQIRHALLILGAPKLAITIDINKLGLDVESVTAMEDAAGHYGSDVQFGGSIMKIAVAFEAKNGCAWDHTQATDFREIIDERFCDAFAEVFRIGIVTEIHERQYGN